MNDIEKQNILAIAHRYKNICITLDIYVEFLDPLFSFIDPITDRETIRSGLFAMIGQTKCWVSRIVPPNHVLVSDEEISNATKEEDKWSLPLPLVDMEQIDRIMKLKAFW